MAKVSNWDKFRLLLWKNWILQWTRKWGLAFEVILPPAFILLLVFLRSLVKPEMQDIETFKEQNITNLDLLRKELNYSPDNSNLVFELLYSPKNVIFENIVKAAAQSLELEAYNGYDNASALEIALMNKNSLAGIQFDDSMVNITSYPEKLIYSIRFPSELRTSAKGFGQTWFTMRLFPDMELSGPRNSMSDDGGLPVGYLREGFLPVQQAISTSFIKLKSGRNTLPEIVMQRYPYPAFLQDPLLQGLPAIMTLIIFLSFLYSLTSLTKSITTEKEKELKEIMKIMGLQNWIHWSAWFVKAFMMWGLSAVLICAFLKIPMSNGASVLTNSSWSVILLFLLIYVITSICFCFMFGVFFNKANTAAAVSGLIWFISYLPFSFSTPTYNELSLGSKLFYCLFVNSGMGLGFKITLGFENTGEGVHWHNLFKTYSVDENLSLGACLGMMLLSSVIYMIICLYVEQIFPGEYGMPKKWYFPFTKAFWCGEEPESHYLNKKSDAAGVLHLKNSAAFEADPVGKRIGVRVRNLRKTFGDKTAVRDLSVNMYEDEITVLLGHNGAGKTTTISMLTGMFPPTSGTATVNGYDIRMNTEEARSSMGICPQHNVLFDEMSVANHIVFFSRLKGVRNENIPAEVGKYLKIIELENKANVAASKLSGGMKRKLSVCCALCGDTKVVLCDEPSSGMDPAARRQLWDLLQAEKTGRTLLLTTHFMDEADILGDRIAIMCGGQLKCHGTPFFLKKKYGSGYRLICVKRENCRVSDVTALLNEHISGIEPENDIGAELTYQLPDSFSSEFENMLSALEEKSNELNLSGYGIGITSMEEVFMKVGAENSTGGLFDERLNEMDKSLKIFSDVESMHSSDIFTESTHMLKGSSLCLNQWKAMFLKKFLYTWRNKIAFFLQNMIAIFFVAITIVISMTSGVIAPLQSIEISLKQYPVAVTVLETTKNVMDSSLEASVSKYYESISKSYGEEYTFESTKMSSFSDYILDLGKTKQVRINSRYLTAATIDNGKITAWLNNQPYHTAPLTVNFVNNALAKALIGDDAEIRVLNAPLPYSTKTQLDRLNFGNNLGTQLATNICFAMCFVSAFYVLFAIKERASRSKLLQFVGGVNVWTFWLTQLLWDFMTYIFTVIVVIITIVCFQQDGFVTFAELGRYFVVLAIFGVSVLPFTYIISFTVDEPASGFSRVSIINIFAGMALFVVITVMSIEFFNTKELADKLRWVFRIFPHFSLANSLNNLFANGATRSTCESTVLGLGSKQEICIIFPKCCNYPSYFAWKEPGVLPDIVYMLVTAVIFFLIIIMRELQVISELMHRIHRKIMKPPALLPSADLDDDVEKERNRILTMPVNEFALKNLVLDRVTKYYNKFLAVNQVSLCVEKSECFGLLGVNGAGKTTTFKMLTGDERMTYGSAYVKGYNLQTEMNQVYKDIGYCPQFDALLDDLTGREMLRIFCLLRGIPTEYTNELSENLAIAFGFMKHMDKPTKTYSGGNKRKLSAAIAVIGSPSVIYLDEPTSGMDPAARRQLWNMVCSIRDSGKSIVLTSHSMEECEALCTRLAIMVNGEFKCIGSTQHLKNKFSKGLILKIKVRLVRDALYFPYENDSEFSSTHHGDQNIMNVKNFVAHEFPTSILQEEYQGILTFYIPLSGIKWSRIFGLMERNRNELNIDDYSISQTTLEEIFLEFANQQREDKRVLK